MVLHIECSDTALQVIVSYFIHNITLGHIDNIVHLAIVFDGEVEESIETQSPDL